MSKWFIDYDEEDEVFYVGIYVGGEEPIHWHSRYECIEQAMNMKHWLTASDYSPKPIDHDHAERQSVCDLFDAGGSFSDL